MAHHHRHQASLENILDFSSPSTLSVSQREFATRNFYLIINYFDDEERASSRPGSVSYNRPRLVQYTYEYALSEESRDFLLQTFFHFIGISLDSDEDTITRNLEEIRSSVVGFAEFLMDNFFLPLRAATYNTPQPSPAFHSAVLMVQGGNQEYTTTPTRISALRGTSLVRDHHRCVISRAFDVREANKRLRSEGQANARDDDGNPLSGPYNYLEVAHIIPHSLMRLQEGSNSRQDALAVLNMFDNGIARVIEGVEIDRPFNTLTLAQGYHQQFGAFETFFTKVTDQEPPHTYKIETFQLVSFDERLSFPVTRTLLLSPNHNIDPPSSRLLAIHRAIAHILHLSGAGEYINKFLSDMDDGYVRSDGSTQLDRFVRLRFRNWGDGIGVH